MISLEKWMILTPLQKYLRMWEIWAIKLLPKALKSCPKSNKLPNLVTLLSEPIGFLTFLLGNQMLYFLRDSHKILFLACHTTGLSTTLDPIEGE